MNIIVTKNDNKVNHWLKNTKNNPIIFMIISLH